MLVRGESCDRFLNGEFVITVFEVKLSRLDQVDSKVRPSGVIAPMPVITTRRVGGVIETCSCYTVSTKNIRNLIKGLVSLSLLIGLPLSHYFPQEIERKVKSGGGEDVDVKMYSSVYAQSQGGGGDQ